MSAISDIGGQVADIARTQGELNALKEARKTHPDLTVEQLKETQTYRDEQAKFGTGSTIQRGIQAATAALQGLAGGDIAGALAGASAPELAHLLKSTEDNPAVNTLRTRYWAARLRHCRGTVPRRVRPERRPVSLQRKR
ncbi:hypothetical protein PO568_20845 [Enterobacter cloacae]